MKAAVIEQYGDSKQFIVKEIPKPTVGDHELLIKINASSVNPIDWKIRSGAIKYIYPLQFPAVLGFDLAGEVEAIGAAVKQFKVGDAVYTCSNKKAGEGYAQWIALDESTVSLKPSAMNFKEAASVPLAAMTALQALQEKSHVKAKDNVLVIGASGGVGMFAVQIAKALGARVTAVCSTRNIDFVKSLGADEVIDYTKTKPLAGPQLYEVIFDCVGTESYLQAKQKLTTQGVYVTTLPTFLVMAQSLINRFTSKQGKFILLRKNKQDLDTITQLIDEKKLVTYIDSEFTLDDIALAHQRSETHKAIGKIIVTT